MNTPGRCGSSFHTEQFLLRAWQHCPSLPSHLCPEGPPYFSWATKSQVGHLSLTSGALCFLLFGHPTLFLIQAFVPISLVPQSPGSGLSVTAHTTFRGCMRLENPELAKPSVADQGPHRKEKTDSPECPPPFLVKTTLQEARQSCQDPQWHLRGAAEIPPTPATAQPIVSCTSASSPSSRFSVNPVPGTPHLSFCPLPLRIKAI